MTEVKNNQDVEVITPEDVAIAKQYFEAQRFAQINTQQLRKLDNDQRTKKTFTKITKDQLIGYLQAPETNYENIQKASEYMFLVSSQYRRLVMYYALVPMWCYTILPVGFDNTKAQDKTKQYFKLSAELEKMNIKHEMQKACAIAYRDDVFYGVICSTADSFTLQSINPSYCQLTSIVDGAYSYAVDMSKIRKNQLELYPPQFTTMYNAYKNGGTKLQQVPDEISFCLKVNESIAYPMPPFAATLPLLYDIQDFIDLFKTRTEIGNYKMIGMEMPTDDKGRPTLDFGIAEKYYQQLAGNLPDYVGAAISPMKLSSFDFQKSGSIDSTNIVSMAEEEFWNAAGTSGLLFGSSKNDSSAAMKLSINADESLMFGVMNQCERLINRYIKLAMKSTKFRISILPVTIYNQTEMADKYLKASTYGIPVKSAYAATLGLSGADLAGAEFVEKKILKVETLTPLSSSATMSSADKQGGRPTAEESGGSVGDEGEKTRESGANANR